jgi:hypothetical protein
VRADVLRGNPPCSTHTWKSPSTRLKLMSRTPLLLLAPPLLPPAAAAALLPALSASSS